MAVTADIKFTQASGATDIAGRAVKGIFEGIPANDKVTITNGDNTNVDNWKIELLYNPPGSALGAVPGTPVVLGQAVSPTPSADLDPDVIGSCFRIRLTVWDSVGNSDIDIRNFAIPDGRGIIRPPYQKLPDPILLSLKADELNFDGQVYGWLGDSGSGTHYDFFTQYDDLPFTTVTTTPFTAKAVGEAPLYLVDMTAIGSNAVFNLPSGARIGQRIRVLQHTGSFWTLTVVPPGGHVINGFLPSVITQFQAGGEFLYVGGNNWVLPNLSWDYVERSIVAGVENVDVTGFTSIGSTIPFAPESNPNGSFTWSVVLETSNAADAAEIRLYNVTLGAVVAGSVLSTTSITPVNLSAVITPATGLNLYSAQMRLQTTGSPNVATCRQAQVITYWFQP
jgi:hypothetical protein